MAKQTETGADDDEGGQPLTIGDLADMLPLEVWVDVPGFPGWRVKRLRDGSVVTGNK